MIVLQHRDFFDISQGFRHWKDRQRVFDWCKAAKLIHLHNIKNAAAGLAEDWSWTSGAILRDGTPVLPDATYTYLASTWATPVLQNQDNAAVVECWAWRDETPYDAHTFWPEEALKLLEEKNSE